MLTCFADAQTLSPSETPLHALFRHAAERPNAIALIAGGDVWSYHRLASEVVCLSTGLRRAGIRPGDRIVLSVRTSPVYAVFMFAAMLTGAIVVPLKVEFKPRELNEFLGWLRPALFVHETELQDVVAQLETTHTRTFDAGDRGPSSWRHLLAYASRAEAVLPVDIDSTFLLLATSGTTGMPKLVAYNQRVMSHVIGSLVGWSLGPDARVIGSTPVAQVSGTLLMLASVVHGGQAVLISHLDADAVLDAVEQCGATRLFVPPGICMPMVEAQRTRPRDVSSLRLCGVGGDTCPVQIAEVFESTFNLKLGNTYGLTECIGSTVFGEDRRALRGVPGRTRLVDAAGVAVAQGTVGELQLRGPNLSLGYWTGPGDIISHTRDGWFATGDLMQQDVKGDYWFVGRCLPDIGFLPFLWTNSGSIPPLYP
ncbi:MULTISPECIES: class I adenylate-forming enzyme family protein [unclassified Pseudomonas]|uniref:class I adenylate-forming enzyme family protein n=1 Tax=unclassified Pseudomonas TaxID=196821 RepID=UPI00159FE911|nr:MULTISPECIES: class I adenylate-forming enzyme family protein [unclassified Pseudomonas]NWC96246.1 acyl--CoA ligase [Pseudomonas sp. IPO3779]NWD16762.1 acyl--CoA ligase [Pseudomonas sp. IPO3778]